MTHTQPENSSLAVKLTQRWIQETRHTQYSVMRLDQIRCWYPEHRHFLTPIEALYVRGVLSLGEFSIANGLCHNFQWHDVVPARTVLRRPLASIVSEYNEIMLNVLRDTYFKHLHHDIILFRVLPCHSVKVTIDNGELVRTYALVRRVKTMYHVATCDGGLDCLCTYEETRRCLQPCD